MPLFRTIRKRTEMEQLLEVKNLSVSIDSPAGEVQAVRDVSFSLKKGEVLAIVGESGCGKSMLCKSIMKLLPPSARIKNGSISEKSDTAPTDDFIVKMLLSKKVLLAIAFKL